MSKKRRSFTPEFKTKVVLEALSGLKELNELASEHEIQPNLIRNREWEFLENAPKAFDNKADEKAIEAIDELQAENDELAKKIGRQLIQIDWAGRNGNQVTYQIH